LKGTSNDVQGLGVLCQKTRLPQKMNKNFLPIQLPRRAASATKGWGGL